MDNRIVAHDLTKFLRAQEEQAPQKLPLIEVDQNAIKPLQELYEIFWQATIPVARSERVERLAKIEFQIMLTCNRKGLRKRVNELQAVAKYLDGLAVNIRDAGDKLGYKEDSSGMKAAYLKAKPYQSAALLLKAIAWYISEICNDPHNKNNWTE